MTDTALVFKDNRDIDENIGYTQECKMWMWILKLPGDFRGWNPSYESQNLYK